MNTETWNITYLPRNEEEAWEAIIKETKTWEKQILIYDAYQIFREYFINCGIMWNDAEDSIYLFGKYGEIYINSEIFDVLKNIDSQDAWYQIENNDIFEKNNFYILFDE